ncbi:hypothetical protein BGV40_11975 [Methanosarcina sp. Ant1]|nr:hypothetical protein BGV40_11975 [Methanosarcina sp. Ant1]
MEGKIEINGTFHFKKRGIMNWMQFHKAIKFQFNNRRLLFITVSNVRQEAVSEIADQSAPFPFRVSLL